MRKYLLAGILLTASLASAKAQDGFVSQTGAPLSYNVFDKNGKTFVNPTPDVNGTPFLTDDWKLGTVVTNTNRRYDTVKVRLNILSQEIHILDRNNTELALAQGYIKEVILPGPFSGENLHFQNGFPAVDEQDGNSFYEILTQGKLWLLHSSRKVIIANKDVVSGETSKEYRLYEDYYLYDGKTMQRIKKEKATINGKELKFKSIGDLKKAVDEFNAS
ncbi:MAG TPA: hypothetical protein VHW43_00175 [Puia sp.]|jgi:hypothetical protein|nr:hypothetical protein [Puia sp.]